MIVYQEQVMAIANTIAVSHSAKPTSSDVPWGRKSRGGWKSCGPNL